MKSKRITLFLLLSLLFLSLVGGETKYGFEIWSRYQATFENENEFLLTKNQIYSPRGYFTVEPKLSDNIKGRFTLDFVSLKDGVEGASVRLKYAYLDFSNLPIKSSNINFGLIKNYFGTVYDYEYPVYETELSDKEKVVNSADYGVSFNGLLPAGFGFYAFSIMNGEGYKKTDSSVDLNPAFLVNLRLIPVIGLTVGGSVLYEDKTLLSPESVDSMISDSLRMAYVGLVKYNFNFLSLSFEYLSNRIDSVIGAGYSVIGLIDAKRIADIPLELVARYDSWDKNLDATFDGHKRIIAGTNMNFFKDNGVIMQLSYDRTMYEDTTKADVNNVIFQMKWKFSNTLQ
uniref:Porin n=1 Tax=candidate division WOR-3 bacterium TaxID=2052148 RepID=A0A7C3J5R4_UNCW3